MSKISQSVLQKIKDKNITPKPKWHFILKYVAIWFSLIFIVLIGSLSVSIIARRLSMNEWDIYHRTGRGIWAYILYTLPYFWIVIMILATIGSIYYFRKTKRAYKHRPLAVLGAVLLITTVLGVLIHYHTDYPFQAERFMERQFPIHRSMGDFRDKIWQKPDQGLLAGEILEIEEEFLRFRDLDEREWSIRYGDSRIMFEDLINEGEMVKIIGENKGDIFEAEQIRPWTPRADGRRGMMKNRMQMEF